MKWLNSAAAALNVSQNFDTTGTEYPSLVGNVLGAVDTAGLAYERAMALKEIGREEAAAPPPVVVQAQLPTPDAPAPRPIPKWVKYTAGGLTVLGVGAGIVKLATPKKKGK